MVMQIYAIIQHDLSKPYHVHVHVHNVCRVFSNFSTFIGSKSGGTKSESDSDVINIFSLASGHMYERLLRCVHVAG